MNEADGVANNTKREVDATDLDGSSPSKSDPTVTVDSSAVPGTSFAAGVPTSREPKFIGPYQLIRRLGEGGMGQVWLAEQSAPVKRRVALKLIKVGMYDDGVLQRFYSERQSLAMMDHPAIAKVFDAGATPDGQPYFVMEYVQGAPISQYCDRKRLTIRQRLELFIKVCEGVQHAHQKAIIHRDLKPANILVAEVDGKPLPRIIDFGLAKATGPEVGDETMMTRAGSWVGTLGYMSPEQADSTVQDVDTRTDVYSLGVVLYVLLAGDEPFDTTKWKKQPFHEVLRQLREVDPPRPSSKIRTDKPSSTSRAENRGVQPKQLENVLHGDLDWITMRALEKDRGRRYGSPFELAADIHHYLQNDPVLARPSSKYYRLRKYVQRHKVGVAAGTALFLLLVTFAIVQAIQVRRIVQEKDRVMRERDRADRVTTFMSGMFKVSDPSESRGNNVTAREILDKASIEIGSGLSKDRQLAAKMMYVMGTVYENLGLYSRSQSLLEQAISIQNSALGPENSEALQSANALAQVLDREGQSAQAEKLARTTLDTSRRVLGTKHPDTLKSTGNLAVILEDEGKYAESETLTRELLEVAQSVLGPEHPDTVKYRSNLATIMNDLARYADAEQLLRHNLEIDRRTLGPDHPETLNAMNSVAVTLADAGRLPEAEKIERELLEVQRRVLGAEHPDTLRSMSNLANYLSDQGRYADAEELQRATLAIQRRVLPPGHPETLRTMDNLANAISEQGRYAEAEKLERETVDLRRQYTGPDHPFTANAVYNLACILAKEGRRGEALSLLQQSIEHGLPLRALKGLGDDTDLISLHRDPRFTTLVAHAKQVAQSRAAAAKPQ